MSPRRFVPAVVAGLVLTLSTGNAQDAPKTYDDPVLERMRKDVFFLASPECEGRGVETKGLREPLEKTFRDVDVSPLFEPRVPTRAHVRELRYLFTTQPRRPSS